MIKSLDFLLNAMEKREGLLNREVTKSNLHFKKVTQAARLEEGKRHQEDVSGGENESGGISDTFAEEKHFMRMTS